ncbi:site-specific integrase [Flavisolibacter sp. BT320]|nr:site-specific integrase [Flavisolibacter longurius]
MKASLWFYVNKQKKSRKSGITPIYLRVLLHGKKAEGRLYEADLQEKDLPLWDEGTMRLRAKNHKANKFINDVQADFDDFLGNNRKNMHAFTALSIRDLLLGPKKQSQSTLIAFVDQYYATSILNNANIAESTKKCYQKAIRHLKAFLLKYKKQHLLVQDLSASLAMQFKDYLLCETGDAFKRGMTEVSALGNIKKFRTIFDRAVDEGLLDKNPFKMVKLKNRSPQKPRLTTSQLHALFHLDLNKFPRLSPYRDLFLFSCFTGLAYEDAHNLSNSNLVSLRDGEVKIYLSREKTDILTEVVLITHAKNIIDKYRKEPENIILNRVLPQRSNQKVNVQLKILSNMIELPFELKSHTGRHTFRQLLGEAGIAEMAVIKRMMGHNRSGDIDNVYYQITEEKLIRAKEKLQKYSDEQL